jgi:hypothetical protein
VRASSISLTRHCEQFYLLLAFPKNVQANLTPEQARRVRALVEVLKAQDCYGNER